MTARQETDVVENGGARRLHLTLAVSDYDHVRDLAHGLVRPEGIALNTFVLPVEEIFYRLIRHLEWDISEASFGKYISLVSQGDPPMVAIPVFPSRVFRHSAIYVRADRGIATPKQLENRVVGIPEWAQTAGIYARGMLAEAFGVDLSTIHWVQAGVNEPGRDEKVELKLPSGMRYEARTDKSLSDLLLAGEIDAAISAREPAAFSGQGCRVTRLFPDYRREELAYYRHTGIFPIMHVIAVRRDVFERHPWIATNLCKAFEEARRCSVGRVTDITASRFPLPWSAALASEFASDFGPDPFQYGLEANRHTLDAFCRFAHEQGVTHRRVSPDELFPAEARSTVKI